VRDIVNANLPPGFEEGMQYGMIGWYVPLVRYPDTYNGQHSRSPTSARRRTTWRST